MLHRYKQFPPRDKKDYTVSYEAVLHQIISFKHCLNDTIRENSDIPRIIRRDANPFFLNINVILMRSTLDKQEETKNYKASGFLLSPLKHN